MYILGRISFYGRELSENSHCRQDWGLPTQKLRVWNRSEEHLCIFRSRGLQNTTFKRALVAMHALESARLQDSNCADTGPILCSFHRYFGKTAWGHWLTRACCIYHLINCRITGALHFDTNSNLRTHAWSCRVISRHQQHYFPTGVAKLSCRPFA